MKGDSYSTSGGGDMGKPSVARVFCVFVFVFVFFGSGDLPEAPADVEKPKQTTPVPVHCDALVVMQVITFYRYDKVTNQKSW